MAMTLPRAPNPARFMESGLFLFELLRDHEPLPVGRVRLGPPARHS
jgi:hypothetical protein